MIGFYQNELHEFLAMSEISQKFEILEKLTLTAGRPFIISILI